ncbi:unnamed protein product [Lampetra planeri]
MTDKMPPGTEGKKRERLKGQEEMVKEEENSKCLKEGRHLSSSSTKDQWASISGLSVDTRPQSEQPAGWIITDEKQSSEQQQQQQQPPQEMTTAVPAATTNTEITTSAERPPTAA